MYLHIKLKARSYLFADGCAEYSPPVTHHKVYLFGGYGFGRSDEVAFVFAIFVIHYNHKLSFLKVYESLLNSVQFIAIHRCGLLFFFICGFVYIGKFV